MTRRLAPLLLSLLLGLASVGAAMARVEASMTWQITLCTGDGVVEISLDADGNPVSRAHHCPDCLTGAALGMPPALMPAAHPADLPEPALWRAAFAAPSLVRLPPRAQGPPAAG